MNVTRCHNVYDEREHTFCKSLFSNILSILNFTISLSNYVSTYMVNKDVYIKRSD